MYNSTKFVIIAPSKELINMQFLEQPLSTISDSFAFCGIMLKFDHFLTTCLLHFEE